MLSLTTSQNNATLTLAVLQGQLETALTQWQRAQAGNSWLQVRALRVIIADGWLSQTELPWGPMMKRPATALRFARDYLAGAGFEVGLDDTIRLDDGAFGAPRLAVAYPAGLMAMLARLAKQFDAPLSSVLPLSVAAWGQTKPAQRAAARVLAIQDDALLLFARGHGALFDVKVRPGFALRGDADSDVAVVGEQWQRMRLRDPQLNGMTTLPVLRLIDEASPRWPRGLTGVTLPPQATGQRVSPRLHLAHLVTRSFTSLDAQRARPTPGLGWGMALGAALSLTMALVIYAGHTASLAKALTAEETAGRAVVRPVSRATLWSADELGRVQATNAAIRQLNLPVTALLQTLAPPQDVAAAVLSVEVIGAAAGASGRKSAVKIVAEAPSSKDMARYVEFVAKRQPFSEVYLTQHEVLVAVPSHPYRFSMEAIWSN
ncbi:hypothetical protein [Jeongeupia sp. USM3]|uniref:hypothetical protein n=1 Tax=Jeongeupia sp. USM3 TaxID=1906741 RepID=UPI0011AB32A6|nr:hypothetical protein [Jeongeupia sp. USM3]